MGENEQDNTLAREEPKTSFHAKTGPSAPQTMNHQVISCNHVDQYP